MKVVRPVTVSWASRIVHLILLIVTSAFFIALARYLPLKLAGTIQMGSGDTLDVLVLPGMNARGISRVFASSGLTDRPDELSRWFTREGIDRSIRPGLYRIRKGTPWEIARQMAVAEPEVSGITLYPGETYEVLLARLGETFESALGRDDLFPEKLRPFLPPVPGSRIAFLIPETYSVTPSDGAVSELVRAASALWMKRVGERILGPGADGDTLLERAIVASLVEKEAKHHNERPIISGVIRNRSEAGMKLQIDATVVYAWSLRGVDLKRVLYRDLEIDSPFNTYRYAGLPPAPICTPSEESWLASIEPEDVPFLYYVAMPDGTHIFSRTFSEHSEAVRRSRNAFGSVSQ
ncbi:MAG TPA: endolytic transglycosylase MltG [Synergistaceae bacterium]|jgi:UPF0755 protein|nr:MAG: Aminodeoxychorismate lyase [Synergistales bacterium 57_84]KUK89107.1 MAG: Aminodeoxychorismate lyase [Synergistales bacterium 58_81]HBG14957.1 endolytic transglycosylase MltG [Synergistaceae bacterium]